MINLTVYSPISNGHLSIGPATVSSPSSVDDTNTDLPNGDTATVTHLSPLARQLSEAHTASNELQVAKPILSATNSPLPISAIGRELMVARIFRGHEPPVSLSSTVDAFSIEARFSFLNYEDRALVSQMYAYAQSQGADLAYVDSVAEALGSYRYFDDGRRILSGNNGFDLQGHAVRYDFLEQDAAAAARILNGTAINTTSFDQGFLRHILDPGFGALASFGNSIGFLEKMVQRFSSEDTEQSLLGAEFATYVPMDVKDNVVITRSKEVMFTLPAPYFTKDNGVWTITEKGREAGYTLDKVTGRPRAPSPVPEGQARVRDSVKARHRQVQERAFLEALSRSRDLPHWLMSLLKTLSKAGER